MSYSLSYFDVAKIDIREAKAWYKKQQPGLEKRFADSIKSTVSKLKDNPLAFAVRYKNIRIAHPKTFPYNIHFYIDDANYQVIIIAILHSKRHPDVGGKRV
jgi:plasmid stabilization system protein ParE